MLGDSVASALAAVGVTPERVEKWLGRPCGCEERQIKLNQLDIWARRVLKGRTEQAVYYLKLMLEES